MFSSVFGCLYNILDLTKGLARLQTEFCLFLSIRDKNARCWPFAITLVGMDRGNPNPGTSLFYNQRSLGVLAFRSQLRGH